MRCPGITCPENSVLFFYKLYSNIATGAPQTGAKPLERQIISHDFHENQIFSDTMMGVETPIPPVAMDAAAPKDAPRRLQLPVSQKTDMPRRASERP
jgi:hypothetical protein